MRAFLVLLVLLGLVGVAGYFTRPSHGLHRGVATTLMTEGRVPRPDAATGRWAFDDFYVVTRSTLQAGGRDVLQCWGVFTRFLCTGAAPQVSTRGWASLRGRAEGRG
jgi:hypothetical protein